MRNIDYSFVINNSYGDAFIGFTKSEKYLGNLSNSGREKKLPIIIMEKRLNQGWELIYDHYNCKSNTSL